MIDNEKLGRISKEKMEQLGIKDNKYEVTLKFNEEDIFVIAATLLMAPGFGYKDPAEFIKFIIQKFNMTIADVVMGGSKDKPETLH
jgi:hypothetical protein